ncbi:PVC-type heme-binding CxxCH protein [Planctomyces sp. SH-PL62]|uniref:PVC-type heme-binding CxxCH protein n=1 Tax=Planctomyces sp. SH-PL62 TaxID=1636152 RepID=UPI00078E341E|nr:PVC-type heme-binding CxxCH protein [Planctomyces sp. SH-PL62]AMV36102.1 Cytochrome c [Planctomyces sp. SH-PL62]
MRYDSNAPRRACGVGLIGLVVAARAAFGDAPVVPEPLAPEAAVKTLKLIDPDLTITLVASEPDVSSPVAAAWDEDGRLFVAEMLDYPRGPASGKVRLLEDRDGDGRYERASTFAEGLNFPNGVLPWNGGVLVTAAPDILFLKDDDGDGRADTRRVVLTGFAEGNTQLRVNGLTWGADGWVYGANGRSDGVVRKPGDPDSAAVPLRFHDFRFRPDTGEIQTVSGFSQFGLPRDDWGRRFPSWNTIPIRHVVLEERTLARNPYLAESATVATILDPADGGRVFPLSPPPTTFNRESTTYFNASCGPTIYRGDLLGDVYRGNAFFGESLTNLVQRRILEHQGPTFLARRAEPDREFLASTDPYFRPVNTATGPDGALYVVDFYREMVEHPDFVPADLRESIEFRRWQNRGRIWRIARKGSTPAQPPRLGQADTGELVALLEHPNGWRRDTAQRLLTNRRDLAALPLLETLARTGATPLGRIHAAWTLDGLGTLDDAIVVGLLADASADVREAAAKLAAGRPGLVEAVATRADDPESRVRFQAAVVLGDSDAPRAVEALARIAARDAEDEWTRLAVLSGLRDTASPFLATLLTAHPEWLATATPGQARLLDATASILGARAIPDELKALAARLAPPAEGEGSAGRIALLLGLSDGLARANRSPRELANQAGFEKLGVLLDRAAETVGSAHANPTDRARALTLLARFRPDDAAALVPALLSADQPPAVQAAAAEAVVEVGSAPLAARIFESWETIPTAPRRAVLAAMIRSTPLAGRLVEAIEDDVVALSELTPAERESLRSSPDSEVAGRAAALLESRTPRDRAEVVARFQPVLSLTGDPGRGRELFVKNCRTCHQHRGDGYKVGPDLSGVASRPESALLKDVLDPNADVSPDLVAFTVLTKRGQTLSGLLVEETAASLKLRAAEGVEESILRSEIEAVRPSGRSLMPEGFEDALGEQGLADLIAFLKQP